MQTAVTVVNLIHDVTTETDTPMCWVFPGCSCGNAAPPPAPAPPRTRSAPPHPHPGQRVHHWLLPYAQWAALPAAEKAKHWTLKRGWNAGAGRGACLDRSRVRQTRKKRTCAAQRRLSRTTGSRCCPTGTWKGAETMSEIIPFGPAAPSTKPVFEPPDGWKYRTDGVQMELQWRPDFGAEKTAALQKAQYALAQEAAKLIDSYVPFDTGRLKNSVNLASKYDEGLLVYKHALCPQAVLPARTGHLPAWRDWPARLLLGSAGTGRYR